MKYVIGNWKANKNIIEVRAWLDEFLKYDFKKVQGTVEIIICPPFPFIPLLKEKTHKFPFIKIGSQDLSMYEGGAYTGEVSAKSLSGMIVYSIIGHSERRVNFQEKDETLFKKAELAKKYNIEPLFCIRGVDDKFPQEANFVVYEPVWAIGTGKYASPDHVLEIKNKLKLNPHQKYIYGGSVDGKNASSYLKKPEIDGVLPGGASLDPHEFYKIIFSI